VYLKYKLLKVMI